MRVDVTYTYHCSAAGCGVTKSEHFEDQTYGGGMHLRLPDVPRGWLELGLLMFCPIHTVLLSVDGHEETLTEASPPT